MQEMTASNGGLTVKAYPGDGMVMLAFDVDPSQTTNFAGFAIRCRPPTGEPYIIPNRLSFATNYTTATTASDRTWTPSTLAPIQKFNWLDVFRTTEAGPYIYDVGTMYFDGANALKPGVAVSVTIDSATLPFANSRIGFTRGYLSSQAYAAQFGNKPFRPAAKSIDYDTAPYLAQYQWLGYHARKLVFDFIGECVSDKSVTVDVFAYDLDEPDFIRALASLGPRVRLFLDNAPLHVGPTAMEPKAQAKIAASAGQDNVKTGHFNRFAHDKVIIQKRNGKAVKVLTGSANFSVRGLYVQANNVLVFNDEKTAGYYGQAFEQAWSDMSGFRNSPIAGQWFDIAGAGLPDASVSFAPHASCEVSLDKVAEAIKNAKHSVLFAIMELGGSGPVMDAIKALPAEKNVFTYGMTQSESGGVTIFRPGDPNGLIVPFSYLTQHVPKPFAQEWNGGMGQVIHHKFVVIDFNGDNPQVFTGSSNLAAGGEESNGDNLLAIADPNIAKLYAVEAMRLVDHYHFRAAVKNATDSAPLSLATGNWWQPYYDDGNIKCHFRKVLAGTE